MPPTNLDEDFFASTSVGGTRGVWEEGTVASVDRRNRNCYCVGTVGHGSFVQVGTFQTER